MYADDVDFISSLYSDNQYIKVTLPIILERWNLFMKLGKTEHTHISKPIVNNLDTKKLESKISTNHKVMHRISKAADSHRLMTSYG